MNPYRTVYPEFWTGTTGKKIREKGSQCQLLAIYLMTSGHSHPTGLFYIPTCFMSHETGLDLNDVEEALEDLVDIGFCEYSDSSEWVWVKSMARYQIDAVLKPGDKRIKWVERALDKTSKGAPGLTIGFISHYKDAYNLSLSSDNPPEQKEAPSKGLRSPLEAPSKPENRDRDRDRDREQRTESTKYSDGQRPDAGADAAGEIIEFANELKDIPSSSTTKAENKAKAVINARLKEGISAARLKAHIARYVEKKRAHTWYRDKYGEDPPINSRLWCPLLSWRVSDILSPERLDKYFSAWKTEGSITAEDLLGVRRAKEKLDFVGSHGDPEEKPFTDEGMEGAYFYERHYERMLQQEMKESMRA
jgi:hypothetical protein